MRREKPIEKVELNYGVSGYKEHVPGVSPDPTIVHVPIQVALPAVNHDHPLDTAERGTFNGRPLVSAKYRTKDIDAHTLQIIWIKERREWVAIQHHTSYEPADGGTDEYCHGPFSLDGVCIAKLVEAYMVPEGYPVPIARTQPSELESLARK